MNLAPFAMSSNTAVLVGAANATTNAAVVTGDSIGNNPIFGKVLHAQLQSTSGEKAAQEAMSSGAIPLTATKSPDASEMKLVEMLSAEQMMEWIETMLSTLDEQLEEPDLSLVDKQLLDDVLQNLQAMFYLLKMNDEEIAIASERSFSLESDNGGQERAAIIPVLQKAQQLLLQLQMNLEQADGVWNKGQQSDQYMKLQLVTNLVNLQQAITTTDRNKPVDQLRKIELPSWVMKENSSNATIVEQLAKLTNANLSTYLLGDNQEQLSSSLQTALSDSAVEQVAAPTISISQLQLNSRSMPTGAVPATTFVMADEFADTLSDMIVQRFSISTLHGISEAKLQLYPEQLGQVDVRLMIQNGQITALFQTDNALAKDILDGQMAQLRSALQAQGLQVEKMVVSHEPASHTTTFNQQQHQQQSNREQRYIAQDADERGAPINFETELLQQTIIQQLGMGRAINTSV